MNFFSLIGRVRISVIVLVNELYKLIKQQEVNKEAFGELKEKVLKAVKDLLIFFGENEYHDQLHAVALIRRGFLESYNLISIVR